ncbi:MAG: hypothetical protein A2Z20_00505 [Bdellovibrionales bacterium RBG_16_40_8]|nr:MAG: hypothetical protein A2Z20_00505 [Bdellovibrionales bacterium RBG_16_40_8]
MKNMEHLNRNDWFDRIAKHNNNRQYKAMFSSWVGGVVTDPALMLVPIDDHMVHRGDGVFEAIRVTAAGPYLLKPHLERLFASAEKISLKVSLNIGEISQVCENILEIAKIPDESSPGEGMLRIFISRGFGDFSPNPYTTQGSQLYIVAMSFTPLALEKYEKGVSLMISKEPVKPGRYAQVKSCNYLPNVMMKKEAIDKGYDFAMNLTAEGFVTEGPTENLLIVNSAGELVAPKFDYTLRGTTLVRTLELAEKLSQGMVSRVYLADLSVDDLRSAREIMMVGTTLGVLPVTKFENALISGGRPGPVAQQLHELLGRDMGLSYS